MADKHYVVALLQHYPALLVEIGAAFVLVAAVISRVLLSRFGIPSIVTLLAFGLAAGPSGFDLLHIDLTNSGTRALLQLAVVIVLFEATLRMDLRGIPKASIAIMAIVGGGLVLLIVPSVARAYHLSELISSMIAAICIVTGPTVIGPLMARLRPRAQVSHLLESEGLALDALGVIVAAAVFASYTSRPGSGLDTAWHITERVGAGLVIGLLWGVIGRAVLTLTARSSSDISKMSVLFLGFAAYASAEALAHESGLVAVVACGLLLDFRTLPHERLLRAFKEDLSMLGLSTVFVLLASQVDVQRLGPLVAPAAAIVGVLIAIRIISVALATLPTAFSIAERALMGSVFPRGIVAVSLATYYATQIPAWGLHGGTQLAGILFLVVVFTIAISTPLSIFLTMRLRLQLPSVIIAGITPATLETARRYKQMGHLPLLVDSDLDAVAFARSHDLDATVAEDEAALAQLIRERRAKFLVAGTSTVSHASAVTVLTPAQAQQMLDESA
ncbi:MAG TPA: cation:proton antiporter [Candidatus Baltobacteraceae bacterium]|nr:cation:proton antiporter [Candidatus Baltobacteraceae bacterium]